MNLKETLNDILDYAWVCFIGLMIYLITFNLLKNESRPINCRSCSPSENQQKDVKAIKEKGSQVR